MKQEALNFTSAVDNWPLSAILVLPEGEPKAIVQICHGMCEHKERYLPFMEYLAEAGFATLIHDMRGHGASIYSDKDLGYMDKGGDAAVVEDAHQLTLYLKERFPNKPFTLFGHSMGSLVVRAYLKRYDADLNALVVSGEVAQNGAAGVALFLTNLTSVFKGNRAESPLINGLVNGPSDARFPNEGTFAWLNRDRDAVAAYIADPLCGYPFKVGGFRVLFQLLLDCYKTSGWALAKKDLPIFFASGADDPCCASPEAFAQNVEFLRTVGYTNVSSELLPGARHEILNELNKDEVYALIKEHLAV